MEDSEDLEDQESQEWDQVVLKPGQDEEQQMDQSQVESSQQPAGESEHRKSLEMSKILNTAYNKLPGFSTTSSSSVTGAAQHLQQLTAHAGRRHRPGG